MFSFFVFTIRYSDHYNNQKYGGQVRAKFDTKKLKVKCKQWANWINTNKLQDVTHLDKDQFQQSIGKWLREYDEEQEATEMCEYISEMTLENTE